jgi:hypothetical protein
MPPIVTILHESNRGTDVNSLPTLWYGDRYALLTKIRVSTPLCPLPKAIVWGPICRLHQDYSIRGPICTIYQDGSMRPKVTITHESNIGTNMYSLQTLRYRDRYAPLLSRLQHGDRYVNTLVWGPICALFSKTREVIITAAEVGLYRWMRWEDDHELWVEMDLERNGDDIFDVSVPTFAWKDRGKRFFKITGAPSGIRTGYLQNRKYESFLLRIPPWFRHGVWKARISVTDVSMCVLQLQRSS